MKQKEGRREKEGKKSVEKDDKKSVEDGEALEEEIEHANFT